MKRREQRKRRWKLGLRSSGSVNLISMMDILTVLLLFLLKSYVAGGEVMAPAPGIHLPGSTADEPPQSSLVIAIDADEILIGDERVASISEAVAGEGMEIGPLAARLQSVRQQQDEILRLQGAAPKTERTATVQGDRDIEFRVLQRVMYTLNQNGYEHISLAVIQKS